MNDNIIELCILSMLNVELCCSWLTSWRCFMRYTWTCSPELHNIVIAVLSHFRQISFLTTKSKVRQRRHHCGMHFIQFRCSKCSNKVSTRSFMLQTGSFQSHFASINVAVCLYIFQSLTGLVVKKAAFGHTFFCYLEPVKGGTLVLLIKKSACWMHPTPRNRGLSF